MPKPPESSGINGLKLFALLAFLLFGGMWLGMGLAALLAPGSQWAQFVGFLMLPLCLGMGMSIWYARASSFVLSHIFKAFLAALKGKDFKQELVEKLRTLDPRNLPGINGFVWVAAGMGPTSGVLIGLSPDAHSLPLAVAVTTPTCVIYGFFVRWLARTGRLPLPDDA